MKLLRCIRNRSGPGTQVPVDPLPHLSGRIGRLEQPDHAAFRAESLEDVIEDKLFRWPTLRYCLRTELLDNSNYGRFFEQFRDWRQCHRKFGLFKLGERKASFGGTELVQRQPDPTEGSST